MDTVPNFTNRNNVAMLVEDIEHRLRATNLDHEPHADEILELVQEQETNVVQETPHGPLTAQAARPKIQDMVSQAQSSMEKVLQEYESTLAMVQVQEKLSRLMLQLDIATASIVPKDLRAEAAQTVSRNVRAQAEALVSSAVRGLAPRTVPRLHNFALTPEQDRALAAKMRSFAANGEVYEAAAQQQAQQQAQLAALSQEVHEAEYVSKVTGLKTRLRIAKAAVMNPEYIDQAVRTVSTQAFADVDNLVQQQRLTVAPMVPLDTERCNALVARMRATFDTLRM
jgi:hypothetical protein